MEQRTYIMVKPDGVQRGLVGKVITRFEEKGFRLCGLKMALASSDVLEEHYAELKERPFFPQLMTYIQSGPVVCMCWAAKDAATTARTIIGATDPLAAGLGTIRGDYGMIAGRNIVHGSDSPDSADREIALWFTEDELHDWTPALKAWILEDSTPPPEDE